MISVIRTLIEVRMEDSWPVGFQEFHKKWKKSKNNNDLYVRFDGSDNLDSLISHGNAIDHTDPAGVYAYPLKYVIDHPGDIWYGHNSQSLRVIRDKSRNKVRLDLMSWRDTDRYLSRVGLDDVVGLAKSRYKDKARGVTAPGKIFMTAIQMLLQKDGRRVVEVGERSSSEQSALLRRMGIDCLEDASSSVKQAAINDREPEQIVWLTSSSYEVLESFRLSNRDPLKTNVVPDHDRLLRKVAAAIAKVMDDRISESDDTTFWTSGGREIRLDAKDTLARWRMNNLKIGQKKHKQLRRNDSWEVSGVVMTEFGERPFHVDDDGSIESAIASFSWWWRKNSVSGGGGTGAKYSKKARDSAREAEKREASLKRLEAEENRLLAVWPEFEQAAMRLSGGSLPKLPENLTLPTMSAIDRDASIADYSDDIISLLYGDADRSWVKFFEDLRNKHGGSSRFALARALEQASK